MTRREWAYKVECLPHGHSLGGPILGPHTEEELRAEFYVNCRHCGDLFVVKYMGHADEEGS